MSRLNRRPATKVEFQKALGCSLRAYYGYPEVIKNCVDVLRGNQETRSGYPCKFSP